MTSRFTRPPYPRRSYQFLKSLALAGGVAMVATLATLALTTTSPAPLRADIPPGMLPQATTSAGSPSGQVPSLAPMIKQVLPAVVNIAVTAKVQIENPLLNDPFFRRFFNVPDQQPQEREAQAIGSGVIVDAEKGYVVTNNHVVDEADTIKVRLSDDREIDAKLIGKDPDTDLAMLQIKGSGLKALVLADSDQLQVGDFVVAVGSPFNLRQTVTSGIVSGLGRTGLGDGIQDFIQTDAAINPGNSGGALVNLKGELIGINSQILSRSGGNMGIGFAIPSNLVKSVMTQLIDSGSVSRGRIGIMGGQELSESLAKALKVPGNHGALVGKIVPGGPAAKAGLQAGDVIVEANGKEIRDFQQFRTMVGLMKVGDKLNLKVYRDGKAREVTVSIGKNDNEKTTGKTLNPKLKGASFGPVTGEDKPKGAQVIAVEPRSPAAVAGLRVGDIIIAVNRQPVANVGEFEKAVAGAEGDLLLQVQRGEGGFFLVLQ